MYKYTRAAGESLSDFLLTSIEKGTREAMKTSLRFKLTGFLSPAVYNDAITHLNGPKKIGDDVVESFKKKFQPDASLNNTIFIQVEF